MVGVSVGVDLVGPPLSFVFFGLPTIHKHLSNPISRRGLKYVISGFTVINENKGDIPQQQLETLTTRHDQLLAMAEQLKQRGKTWRGSIQMNADAHNFKRQAKEFHFLAVAVSQASQKENIRNRKSSSPDSSSGSGSDTPPDQPEGQPTFHFSSSATRDEFFAQASNSADSTSTSSEGAQRTVFVVLDPFQGDPAPESRSPSPLEASYEHKEYYGYVLPKGEDAVSFVSV